MDELRKERLKIIKQDLNLWETAEVLEEEQNEKVEELLYSLLTEDQIDELYFNLI